MAQPGRENIDKYNIINKIRFDITRSDNDLDYKKGFMEINKDILLNEIDNMMEQYKINLIDKIKSLKSNEIKSYGEHDDFYNAQINAQNNTIDKIIKIINKGE